MSLECADIFKVLVLVEGEHPGDSVGLPELVSLESKFPA